MGSASLNTIHLFIGLCISFVTWFLLLLQPQMLLSNLFSCVSHPGNKHYTTPVKSIPPPPLNPKILNPENQTAIYLCRERKESGLPCSSNQITWRRTCCVSSAKKRHIFAVIFKACCSFLAEITSPSSTLLQQVLESKCLNNAQSLTVFHN